MKLIGTEDEPPGWRCFDLARDPEEKRDLGAAACDGMKALAEGEGRGTPWDPRR